MGIEQIPGDCPLKIVQGDDYIAQFNIPFDASGYTFVTTIQEANEGVVSVQTDMSVVSTILTIVQTTFYASVTSLLSQATGTKSHTWKMKYTDNLGLVRTFISGILEVI